MLGTVALACALAAPPSADLVPRLVAALDDADREVRQNVAIALANVGRDAVPALQAALHDPKPLRRAAAAYALGLLGRDATDSVPELIKVLDDPEPEVRRQVALAVNRLVAAGSAPERGVPAPRVSPAVDRREKKQGADAPRSPTPVLPPPATFPDMTPLPPVPPGAGK